MLLQDQAAHRDLALAAVTLVGLSRFVDPPLVWLVAGLLLGAMLLGALQVLADEAAPSEAAAGVAIEALILPAVAAVEGGAVVGPEQQADLTRQAGDHLAAGPPDARAGGSAPARAEGGEC